MKISCLRSDLQTAISNVSRAVSAKSTIPALEGVLVKAYGDKLNISGYNLEIGITTDIDATIKEEGEIVISSRLFFDIVKEITGVEHTDKMWYQYLSNEDCLYFEQHLGMKHPRHQMLGYPVFSQDDARRDIATHNTLLFQLDSQFSDVDRKELVMWGDMGSGFIFVNHEDLSARDFTRLYYCWDCG